MGIETVLLLGLTAFKASQQMSAARDQAKAINANAAARAQSYAAEAKATAKEGTLAAKNKAQQVKLKAASQQSSFLNSGLTLEGTPMSVIQSTFDVGLEDVNQILENYGTNSKNLTNQGKNALITGSAEAKSAFSAGRSEALGTLVGGVSGLDFTGSGSVINSMTGGWSSSAGFTGGFDPSTGITWNSGRY